MHSALQTGFLWWSRTLEISSYYLIADVASSAKTEMSLETLFTEKKNEAQVNNLCEYQTGIYA